MQVQNDSSKWENSLFCSLSIRNIINRRVRIHRRTSNRIVFDPTTKGQKNISEFNRLSRRSSWHEHKTMTSDEIELIRSRLFLSSLTPSRYISTTSVCWWMSEGVRVSSLTALERSLVTVAHDWLRADPSIPLHRECWLSVMGHASCSCCARDKASKWKQAKKESLFTPTSNEKRCTRWFP